MRNRNVIPWAIHGPRQGNGPHACLIHTHGCHHRDITLAMSEEIHTSPQKISMEDLCGAVAALKSRVDPDGKLPDIAQEFGPRDQLVQVRCRGSFWL